MVNEIIIVKINIAILINYNSNIFMISIFD
jgi:hypothetical protein